MKTQNSDDLEYSRAIINCLLACYAGRFTFFKALTDLGVPGVDAEELPRTEEILRRINGWFDELCTSIPLFSAHWTSPGTFEAKRAFDYLEALKPELRWVSGVATKALARGNIRLLGLDELRILTACIARLAMSSLTYCSGNIRFGEALGLVDFSAHYTKLRPILESELEAIYKMSGAFVSPDTTLSAAFVAGFTRECAAISPKALTYVHDINQLTAPFRGGLSFATVDFDDEEAAAWSGIGIPAGDAGYWRAYSISPLEAAAWIKAGVTLPSSTAAWLECGFEPRDAAEWNLSGFSPGEARAWLAAGFPPAEARSFRERGITAPSAVPPRT